MEGCYQLPFVQVARTLNKNPSYMNCSECDVSYQSRRELSCPYVKRKDWTERQRVWHVGGVTGMKPTVCPGFSIALPEVLHVARAYKWWDKGQLDLFYPDPEPRFVELMDIFANGVNASDQFAFKERERRRKQNG